MPRANSYETPSLDVSPPTHRCLSILILRLDAYLHIEDLVDAQGHHPPFPLYACHDWSQSCDTGYIKHTLFLQENQVTQNTAIFTGKQVTHDIASLAGKLYYIQHVYSFDNSDITEHIFWQKNLGYTEHTYPNRKTRWQLWRHEVSQLLKLLKRSHDFQNIQKAEKQYNEHWITVSGSVTVCKWHSMTIGWI